MRARITATVLGLVWSAGARPAAAKPEAQRLYEQRCLYCHSGTATEKLRLRPAQWRQLVERMRSHAPLMISARDSLVIVRYLVATLKLVPAPARVPRPEPVVAVEPRTPRPQPLPQPQPLPEPAPAPPPVEEALPPEPPAEPEDREAEEQGPRLIADKCTKCHTVNRVYTKVDSADIAHSVIERMRHKTGSGISPADAEMLHRFVRSRIERQQ